MLPPLSESTSAVELPAVWRLAATFLRTGRGLVGLDADLQAAVVAAAAILVEERSA